jgi:hypothetical protein
MCAPLGVAGLVKSPEKAALGLVGSKLLSKKKKPDVAKAMTPMPKGQNFGA